MKEDSRALRSIEALQESSFKNFNLKTEERLKQNHPNYQSRSWSLLKSNPKASRNFNKPQIKEVLWI